MLRTWLILLMLCCCAGGCSFGVWGTIYNSSNADRSVRQYNRTKLWRDRSTIRIPYPGEPHDFEVRGGGEVWRYDLHFPPKNLIGRRPFDDKYVKLQLMPSGELFIVDPDSGLPVSPLPPQPLGFPLRPTRR